MKNNLGEFVGGIIGTSTSAIGTALQTSDVLQVISLCITIIGGIISLIVLPILSWWKNSKKDGKIDKDEIKEAVDIVTDGVKGIKESLDDKKGE